MKDRKETGAVRFSSHSTQRVINPKATGMGGTPTSPIRPTPSPRVAKRSVAISLRWNQSPSRRDPLSRGCDRRKKVRNTPGSGRAVGERRPERPLRGPLAANGSLRSGRMRCGPQLGQSDSRRGQGEEMRGAAGGDGATATATEVSHLGMRGPLLHLQHTSSSAREERPRLPSPPLHPAAC